MVRINKSKKSTSAAVLGAIATIMSILLSIADKFNPPINYILLIIIFVAGIVVIFDASEGGLED